MVRFQAEMYGTLSQQFGPLTKFLAEPADMH